MNLVNGEIINSEKAEIVLNNIDKMIIKTLEKPLLDITLVIKACDYLTKNIEQLDIIKNLPELDINPKLIAMYIEQIKQMFNTESINSRLNLELGIVFNKEQELVYSNSVSTQKIVPLGVLFHITAGNIDGLPFMSLLDGLLTGNINIVKLPKEEGGITIALLQELFKIEPILKEYVYVFDYSSKEVEAIKKLTSVANAVIVWGGDDAVSAIRKLVTPNTKIIEWGHKISFAYVTKNGINKEALEKLALNICITNQLFCSSCQGIFLDTDNMQDIYDFCNTFLPILENVCQKNPLSLNDTTKLFIQAQTTLQLYHQQVESYKTGKRIFRGNGCSIITSNDSKLETSFMYRNLWVKPLKKEDILKLRSYKNYLQTAALLCSKEEYNELSEKLIKIGVVKVSDGIEMSNYALGEAHDGMFSLSCYTRIVSIQNK